MKQSAIVLAALAAALFSNVPKGQAEPSPAEQCLQQCKASTEQCIQAAGDDADQLQQCSAQALQCIDSCKS